MSTNAQRHTTPPLTLNARRIKPTHYTTDLHVSRVLGLVNGFAAAATILVCAVVVLNVTGGDGGLDRCLAHQSKSTCLYALR